MKHFRRKDITFPRDDNRKDLYETKKKVLELIKDVGSIQIALMKHGVSWEEYYHWRIKDKRFRMAVNHWLKARREELSEQLRDEIKRRAIDGVDEPVFYQGVRMDTKKVYSDALLIAAAKANLPEYQQQEKPQVTVNVQLNVAIEFIKNEVLPIIKEICNEEQVLEIRSRLNKAVVNRG